MWALSPGRDLCRRVLHGDRIMSPVSSDITAVRGREAGSTRDQRIPIWGQPTHPLSARDRLGPSSHSLVSHFQWGCVIMIMSSNHGQQVSGFSPTKKVFIALKCITTGKIFALMRSTTAKFSEARPSNEMFENLGLLLLECLNFNYHRQ